jgi:hypothetical protein
MLRRAEVATFVRFGMELDVTGQSYEMDLTVRCSQNMPVSPAGTGRQEKFCTPRVLPVVVCVRRCAYQPPQVLTPEEQRTNLTSITREQRQVGGSAAEREDPIVA